MFDFRRFSAPRAVVDWISFTIKLAEPSNGPTIKRHARIINAIPLDLSEGGSATIFQIRIQDPANAASALLALDNAVYSLEEHGHIVTEKCFNAIEVSLDFYLLPEESAGLEEISKVTAHLFKFVTCLDSDNRRLYRDYKGSGKAIPSGMHSANQLERYLAEGYMIGVGNTTDESYFRGYVKTTDNGGKTNLPKEEWRARIERRLQGAALAEISPSLALENLQQIDFTGISKHFKFRKLRDDLNPLENVIAKASDQLGERRSRAKRGGGTRQYSKLTAADVTTNTLVYEALRDLTRRWRTKQRRLQNLHSKAKARAKFGQKTTLSH